MQQTIFISMVKPENIPNVFVIWDWDSKCITAVQELLPSSHDFTPACFKKIKDIVVILHFELKFYGIILLTFSEQNAFFKLMIVHLSCSTEKPSIFHEVCHSCTPPLPWVLTFHWSHPAHQHDTEVIENIWCNNWFYNHYAFTAW